MARELGNVGARARTRKDSRETTKEKRAQIQNARVSDVTAMDDLGKARDQKSTQKLYLVPIVECR